MAIPKRTKKKTVRAKSKSGLSAIPIDKSFDQIKDYFHLNVDRKDLINSMKTYIKNTMDKQDARYVLSCPEHKFFFATHHCATAWYINAGLPATDRSGYYAESLYKYVTDLIEEGKEIYYKNLAKEKDSGAIVSISPMERLKRKVTNTIMQDLLELEDKWIEGDKAELDIYQEFKRHALPNSATNAVRPVVEGWLSDYEAAYNKTCDDAVEGYAHLKRPELNRRIKCCQQMLSDMDRLKAAAKATRSTKVKGPKAADKQVARVKYNKESKEFKLVSIPPIKIVGQVRLYTFNVKYKVLTEYITQAANGFEIKGTTISNFDKVNSRSTKLRKPDEFISIVQNKSQVQISKAFEALTTKVNVPNGRLNGDTILLRVMDK